MCEKRHVHVQHKDLKSLPLGDLSSLGGVRFHSGFSSGNVPCLFPNLGSCDDVKG